MGATFKVVDLTQTPTPLAGGPGLGEVDLDRLREKESQSLLANLVALRHRLFGSLDAGNAITVDKPPGALWVATAFARLFGFNSFTVLAPQAFMGIDPPGAPERPRAARARARPRPHTRGPWLEPVCQASIQSRGGLQNVQERRQGAHSKRGDRRLRRGGKRLLRGAQTTLENGHTNREDEERKGKCQRWPEQPEAG